MSDIFKSALDYFSSSFSAEDNDYVGSNVELGNVKLKIKRLVAEGKSKNCRTAVVGNKILFYFL
jgi:cyclin G-associated kinase